jgi:hypothetical protein
VTTSVTVDRARSELERGIALGWHTGAQLYAWMDGQTVIDIAIGEARPGVPMTPLTLVEWGSATKPVTCAAAALLWQHGLFDLDDPVCRQIPEFAANGKEAVTIRHLLTHGWVVRSRPRSDALGRSGRGCLPCSTPGWVGAGKANCVQLGRNVGRCRTRCAIE